MKIARPPRNRMPKAASASSVSWIWTNTGFRPVDGIPVWDRGFRYGMAVFESIRCGRGGPWFWEEHFAGLAKTASRLGWPLDPASSSPAASLLAGRTGDGFARIYLTAGDGAPTAPVVAPRLLLTHEARQRILPESYAVVESPSAHHPVLGGVKSACYWPNLLALEAARARDAGETLLFNANGHLIGAAMANVFLKKNGTWHTPAAATGAREGIVRQWVLERIPAVEGILDRSACQAAEAFFLTNSWLGIMPVHALQERPIEVPREVRALREELEKVCPSVVSPFPDSLQPTRMR